MTEKHFVIERMIQMAKAGMRRPDPEDPKNHGTENHQKVKFPDNDVKPVPEIQGKARTGNAKAGKT